jgi:predicted nucleic acid-binding protein
MIAFFNNEEGADKVEELLWQGNRAPNSLFMQEINLLEIYYGVYRDESRELAEQTYVKILDLPIKLADSIALAEAKIRRIPLVTCDHHEFDPIQDKNELDFYWIR